MDKRRTTGIARVSDKMSRNGDMKSRSAIVGVFGLSVLGLAILGLAAACDRNGPGGNLEAGQERTIASGNALPAPGGAHQYDAPVAPVDETRNASRIGSVVATSGGQNGQKEKERKELVEGDVNAQEPGDRPKADDAAYQGRESPSSKQDSAQALTAGPPTEARSSAPPLPVTSTFIPPPRPQAPPPEPAETLAPAPAPSSAPSAALAFAADSAEITEAAKGELERIAKRANDLDVRQMELRAYAGGTDIVESRNMALARVLAVRSFLIEQGVKARIDVGTFRPTSGGTNALQRVDVVVLGI